MPAVIQDTFTGSAATTLVSHDGEIGADWSQYVSSLSPLTNFVLNGSGAVACTTTSTAGYQRGSGTLTPAAATTYDLELIVGSGGSYDSLGRASLFAGVEASVSAISSMSGFMVEVVDAGFSNFYLLIFAKRAGFPADLNFIEVNTGVALGAGTYVVHAEVNAARDHLRVTFGGSVVYDANLPAALDQFFYAGFGYGSEGGGGRGPWTIGSVAIGGAGTTCPDPGPALTFPLTGEGAYGAASYPSDHRYPGELPPFFATGHSFEHIGVAEDIAFERGEDRSRQLSTFNPQLVNISTELTQAQFDRFSTWFEQDLRAGVCRFDVLVASQGGTGVSWWTSQFVGNYKWEAFGWYFVVSAQLLLLAGPYATRIAPGLRGELRLLTQLQARLPNDGALRGSMTLTTTLRARPAPAALAGTMALTNTLTGYLGVNLDDRLTEDGQQRIHEFGSRRILE